MISALKLTVGSTNKDMSRLQWKGKNSTGWFRAGILYAAVAAKDIVSSNSNS